MQRSLGRPVFRHYGLITFVTALVLSMTFLVPVMIENGGIFLYYGDFNAQEVPFYQLVHDEILRGNVQWTNLTDLGTATVSSYMFYLIGSPFFWITMLFPGSVVPYLMGPLFMLKFGCAALAAYIYLKRYVRNPMFAVAGGMLYAFSGFSIYNIFFFHFHEPMIIFPLLLYAIDCFMYDGRRGIVAPAVFASCIVNYYFFAGMALFCALYWLILLFSNSFRITLKKILMLAFEIILGFAATAFLILPTVMFIMGNPRLSSFPDGFNALAYDIPQKYWYIILSFFFPPELAAQPNFTPNVDCNWASVSGWLPLAGMTGVIGYLQLRKRDWIKKLIVLLMLFALVPVLNSAFQLLNSSIFYARWYYMFVLILSLATIRALENSRVNWNRAIAWSTGITVGIALFIGIMPSTTYNDDETSETVIGLAEYFERYWIYVAIALISLFAFVLIIKLFGNNRRKLALATVAGICAVTMLSCTYIVQTGNSLDADEKPFIREDAINAGDNLHIDDIKNVRSDFYECVDNLGMFWQIPSINTFHSVVSTSIMDFYEELGITRDVASRPECDSYGIRGLLSCKYLFDMEYDDEYEDSRFIDENGRTEMPGWKYLKTVNGCKVYENENFIPMGFMYDSFITEEEFEKVDERNRSEALLKSLIISKDENISTEARNTETTAKSSVITPAKALNSLITALKLSLITKAMTICCSSAFRMKRVGRQE